jgi:hypothetical protein
LQWGGLALGGLTQADVLASRAAAGETSRDTSVILLYLHGGPSHLETYDLKSDAPTEYRSLYQPIATNVPGMATSPTTCGAACRRSIRRCRRSSRTFSLAVPIGASWSS